jgi:hypothetical protein
MEAEWGYFLQLYQSWGNAQIGRLVDIVHQRRVYKSSTIFAIDAWMW